MLNLNYLFIEDIRKSYNSFAFITFKTIEIFGN